MFLNNTTKKEEVKKKSWVEKVVPVFIIYIIIITVLYAFYTVLYSCGIVDPKPIEREWINYNISLIIPVIIGIGLIHLASMFLSKKRAIGALTSTLLCGLGGIWFLYHMKASEWSSSIKVENIEIAYDFIIFAISGFALSIASIHAYLGLRLGLRTIKPVLVRLLIIIFPIFIIAYLVISNNTTVQKFISSQKSELRHETGVFRGKYNAMSDLKNGNAAILIYGLMSSRLTFDKATGLRYKAIAGCIVSSLIEVYAKSYNDYIRESINKFGLPKNSKLKYSNIILNPTEYMYSDVDGKAVLVKKDTVYYSPDGNSQIIVLSSFNRAKIISNGNKFDFHSLPSINPTFEIKWGPKGSEILLIRVNPNKKTVKSYHDNIFIYVIDLRDGGRLNVIVDKLVKLWKIIYGDEKE